MAAITNTLTWKAVMDTAGFQRGSGQVKRGLDDTGRAAGGAAKGMSTMNKAIGAFIVAGAAKQVGQFALEAVQLAENAEIAARSAEKVLGPAFDTLSESLDKTRLLAGLNTAEFNTLLAQLGLMTEGLGLTNDEQEVFIDKQFRMASDLAAFTPLAGDTGDAILAIQSALKNSFNPLEAFGIRLKAIDVKTRALELMELDAALTEDQASVLALTQLIEERGEAAIGSLGEAGTTTAGQINTLTAETEDLKAELGAELAPVMKFLIGFLLSAVQGFKRLTNAETFFSTRLGAFVGQIRDEYLPIWEKIIRAFELARAGIDFFRSGLKGLTVPKALRTISTLLSRGASVLSGGRFAAGGVVPGPKGQPTAIVAHGGETIGGLGGTKSGGGSPTINISMLMGDPQAVARAVVEALQVYERGNGPVPITAGGVR